MNEVPAGRRVPHVGDTIGERRVLRLLSVGEPDGEAPGQNRHRPRPVRTPIGVGDPVRRPGQDESRFPVARSMTTADCSNSTRRRPVPWSRSGRMRKPLTPYTLREWPVARAVLRRRHRARRTSGDAGTGGRLPGRAESARPGSVARAIDASDASRRPSLRISAASASLRALLCAISAARALPASCSAR